jgi:hypothetical protein
VKPHFDAVRTLVHGQMDSLWDSRTPENKLEVVVIETEACRHLRDSGASQISIDRVSAKLELTDATLRPSRRSMGPYSSLSAWT